MELYEAAIQSARTYGFLQYEVIGLELFALFWLTSTSHPKEHVASGYAKRVPNFFQTKKKKKMNFNIAIGIWCKLTEYN